MQTQVRLAVSLLIVTTTAIHARTWAKESHTPEPMTAKQGYGPTPHLPSPESSLLPTVEIAPAKPWRNDEAPTAAPGFSVARFACGLDHPRWLYVLPNGDVLVAETNAPERPEDSKGIKNYFVDKAMARAGADTPSANRITLLRDANSDGQPEIRTRFIGDLVSPFGMALIGEHFYVADTDAILRFDYPRGATQITSKGVKFADLPGGTLNHHWTKNIIANAAGDKLYATVGSNSNAAEHGMEVEEQRAKILEIDTSTAATRVFASGLRNPNGMAWEPSTGALWTVVNERDELGDNLVPDYLTEVHDGGFYGWPYSYFGDHVDDRIKPQRPDLVAKALVPDYGLGAHTASLGLAFSAGVAFASKYRSGAFIGQHGSWNRSRKSGYQVIFVPFANGRPSGMPEPILTGFLGAEGEARGRPVGVAMNRDGSLLVADDVGNCVWRVTPAESPSSAPTAPPSAAATTRR